MVSEAARGEVATAAPAVAQEKKEKLTTEINSNSRADIGT